MEIMSRIIKFSLISCILASFQVNAGGLLGDAIRVLDADVLKLGKEIDRAHADIKQATPAYAVLENNPSPETIQFLENAQKQAEENVERVSDSVQEINTKLGELKSISEKIEEDKIRLKKERDTIASEKEGIERREQLFSMGFYASLTTNLVALFGFMVRLPTSRLERRLKSLEIEHKQIEIDNLRQKAT